MCSLHCSVPQGYVSGQLLFWIYTEDLPAVSKWFMAISFAKDTNMIDTSHKVNSLVDKVNRELVDV